MLSPRRWLVFSEVIVGLVSLDEVGVEPIEQVTE